MRLCSGLFGRAQFSRGERSSLLISQSAVVERGQLQGVYVLDLNRIASLRYVTLGKKSGTQVEVLAGLQEGERLVETRRTRPEWQAHRGPVMTDEDFKSSSPLAHGLGVAGRIAHTFIDSKLTPLVIVAALLLGAFSILETPREEEPQIVVPMLDVFVQMPGASPEEISQRVSLPMEKLLREVPGVEYVYSISQPGMSMLSCASTWDRKKKTRSYRRTTSFTPTSTKSHRVFHSRSSSSARSTTFPSWPHVMGQEL